ncbi:MAG: hypothetical protein ACRENO_07700 [Thermodesulfobacteriota bacterium]
MINLNNKNEDKLEIFDDEDFDDNLDDLFEEIEDLYYDDYEDDDFEERRIIH